MKGTPANQAFAILTNNCSEPVIELYEQIRLATVESGITDLLYHHNEKEPIPDSIQSKKHYCFTNGILQTLNYIPLEDNLVPGSNHFPLLDFYLNNPDFEYYWCIEDDVRFYGEWAHFFHSIGSLKKQPDFISCYIREYDDEPYWYWWNTLKHQQVAVPLNMRLASFNPIFRISNAALNYINKMLINKWQGHHEVLLPTLLYHKGFRISDFGGAGKYVLPGMKNKFYISNRYDNLPGAFESTMRFRPCIHKMDKPNKLYHPVKASCSYINNHCPVCLGHAEPAFYKH